MKHPEISYILLQANYAIFRQGDSKFIESNGVLCCAFLLFLTFFVTIISLYLEKESLDIWVNGQKAETTHEFTDEGTEMQFMVNEEHRACIRTISSGNKKEGIVYSLFVDGNEIKESYV